ncbi:MAG TPA: OmpH family outer membrane protein [Bacteroidia bacterium]|nr:OmpH family outer membrane protein [Bacteroidia bacterium]HNP98316.1 OmpH family outer membrane protein [Bacteroidia bacterium]
MKKSLVLACIAVLLTGVSALAQTLKFGHIDSGQLIQMMPQTKQADSTLKKFGESLDSQLKGMTMEYQTKLQSYQSKADSMPEAIRTTKEKELTDLGNRIQDFQQTAQESIQKKKEELYGPILKKAEDAIKDIAKEKAYSYIFDTSLGSVIFAQESDNIMPLVKSRLGIK